MSDNLILFAIYLAGALTGAAILKAIQETRTFGRMRESDVLRWRLNLALTILKRITASPDAVPAEAPKPVAGDQRGEDR